MLRNIIVIGEIGINHNGSVELAKKLMFKAKSVGCDLVKFQKRDPDITTPENKKEEIKNTPWGQMTYLQYKKKIELGKKDYDEINKFAKKIGINWFASAWDLNSIKFLKKYNLKYNKIASAMITNKDFLIKIAKEKKLTLISTGMSTMRNIENAVKIFRKFKCKFVLMHSVSSYPTPEKDLNLKMIPQLQKKFKCEVGYSGHEATLSPSVGACYLGASYIERHITLDRTMWGTDQAASLSIDGLEELVKSIKKVKKILGDGKKRVTKEEKEKMKSLRYW